MPGFVIESPVWRLELEAHTQDDLVAIVEDIADDARRACPTGESSGPDHVHMVDTIETAFEPGIGYVKVGTDHWAPIEYGSEDHDIVPRGPGYPLRFFWDRKGHMAFFYRVHHPGTPAQPFMRFSLYRRRHPRSST
jgi:hypothetical protein